jgi:hypothetical protein
MQKLGAVLVLLIVFVAADAPFAAAAREPDPLPPPGDSTTLASPDYEGYRPAWADPYAGMPDLGINDDPTPFDPGDGDSGPNPLEPDAF